jgi:CRP/FNR family transcriptional regulator, cyclic AMP receptor protein
VDAEQTLRAVPLFQNVNPKHVKALAKWTATRTFEPGKVIVAEGQIGMGLYCIQSGKVKVSLNTAKGPHDIRTMGPGETFGELSLLDSEPRSATVTAVEETTVVMLDKPQFLAQSRTHPELLWAIIPILARWLRESDKKVAELS